MRHVISVHEFKRETLEELFTMSDHYRIASHTKSDKNLYRNMNIIVATLFYEPSTRTRLSFESAIHRLGMNNISTENAKTMSSAIKGETLEDTIRVISGYADAIVLRHPDNDSAIRAAKVSRVPIINAGSGSGEHPTQALLDLYTIRRHHSLDGLKICIVGDLLHGRTVHSLVKLLSLYKNVQIYTLCDDVLALPIGDAQYFSNKGGDIHMGRTSWTDIPRDVDVIYQTRVQKERFTWGYKLDSFTIDRWLLGSFKENTIVMHPLPRVDELSTDVDDDPRAVYFEQARNGTFVRMALLNDLLL